MAGWNLPPGCSESDIPGNSPFDAWFDNHIEDIWEDYDEKQFEDPWEEYAKNPEFEQHVEACWENAHL